MNKKRILIFDDDSAVLDVLTIIFLEQGYEVKVSQTFHNVIASTGEFHPDLILLDDHISKIDGAEAIGLLRKEQEFYKIPVILLSANTNIVNTKNSLGANDYLSKPFDLYDLETIVTKYIA